MPDIIFVAKLDSKQLEKDIQNLGKKIPVADIPLNLTVDQQKVIKKLQEMNLKPVVISLNPDTDKAVKEIRSQLSKAKFNIDVDVKESSIKKIQDRVKKANLKTEVVLEPNADSIDKLQDSIKKDALKQNIDVLVSTKKAEEQIKYLTRDRKVKVRVDLTNSPAIEARLRDRDLYEQTYTGRNNQVYTRQFADDEITYRARLNGNPSLRAEKEIFPGITGRAGVSAREGFRASVSVTDAPKVIGAIQKAAQDIVSAILREKNALGKILQFNSLSPTPPTSPVTSGLPGFDQQQIVDAPNVTAGISNAISEGVEELKNTFLEKQADEISETGFSKRIAAIEGGFLDAVGAALFEKGVPFIGRKLAEITDSQLDFLNKFSKNPLFGLLPKEIRNLTEASKIGLKGIRKFADAMIKVGEEENYLKEIAEKGTGGIGATRGQRLAEGVGASVTISKSINEAFERVSGRILNILRPQESPLGGLFKSVGGLIGGTVKSFTSPILDTIQTFKDSAISSIAEKFGAGFGKSVETESGINFEKVGEIAGTRTFNRLADFSEQLGITEGKEDFKEYINEIYSFFEDTQNESDLFAANARRFRENYAKLAAQIKAEVDQTKAQQGDSFGEEFYLKEGSKQVIVPFGGYGGEKGMASHRLGRVMQEIFPEAAVLPVENKDNEVANSIFANPLRWFTSAVGRTSRTNIRGFDKDAVEAAKKAYAISLLNPEAAIASVGYSGGGMPATHFNEIMKAMGVKAKSFTFATPTLSNADLSKEENINLIGDLDPLRPLGEMVAPGKYTRTAAGATHMLDKYLTHEDFQAKLTEFLEGQARVLSPEENQKILDIIPENLPLTEFKSPNFQTRTQQFIEKQSQSITQNQQAIAYFDDLVDQLKQNADETIGDYKNTTEKYAAREAELQNIERVRAQKIARIYENRKKREATKREGIQKIIAQEQEGIKAKILADQQRLGVNIPVQQSILPGGTSPSREAFKTQVGSNRDQLRKGFEQAKKVVGQEKILRLEALLRLLDDEYKKIEKDLSSDIPDDAKKYLNQYAKRTYEPGKQGNLRDQVEQELAKHRRILNQVDQTVQSTPVGTRETINLFNAQKALENAIKKDESLKQKYQYPQQQEQQEQDIFPEVEPPDQPSAAQSVPVLDFISQAQEQFKKVSGQANTNLIKTVISASERFFASIVEEFNKFISRILGFFRSTGKKNEAPKVQQTPQERLTHTQEFINNYVARISGKEYDPTKTPKLVNQEDYIKLAGEKAVTPNARGGLYDPSRNTIVLGKDYQEAIEQGSSHRLYNKAVRTLAHESRHALQYGLGDRTSAFFDKYYFSGQASEKEIRQASPVPLLKANPFQKAALSPRIQGSAGDNKFSQIIEEDAYVFEEAYGDVIATALEKEQKRIEKELNSATSSPAEAFSVDEGFNLGFVTNFVREFFQSLFDSIKNVFDSILGVVKKEPESASTGFKGNVRIQETKPDSTYKPLLYELLAKEVAAISDQEIKTENLPGFQIKNYDNSGIEGAYYPAKNTVAMSPDSELASFFTGELAEKIKNEQNPDEVDGLIVDALRAVVHELRHAAQYNFGEARKDENFQDLKLADDREVIRQNLPLNQVYRLGDVQDEKIRQILQKQVDFSIANSNESPFSRVVEEDAYVFDAAKTLPIANNVLGQIQEQFGGKDLYETLNKYQDYEINRKDSPFKKIDKTPDSASNFFAEASDTITQWFNDASSAIQDIGKPEITQTIKDFFEEEKNTIEEGLDQAKSFIEEIKGTPVNEIPEKIIQSVGTSVLEKGGITNPDEQKKRLSKDIELAKTQGSSLIKALFSKDTFQGVFVDRDFNKVQGNIAADLKPLKDQLATYQAGLANTIIQPATKVAAYPFKFRNELEISQSAIAAQKMADEIEISPEEREKILNSKSLLFGIAGFMDEEGKGSKPLVNMAKQFYDPSTTHSVALENVYTDYTPSEGGRLEESLITEIQAIEEKLNKVLGVKLPEGEIQKRVGAAVKNLPRLSQPLLDAAVVKGRNPDDIRAAAEIIARQRINPNATIDVLGYSAGGSNALGITKILNQANVKASGASFGFPFTGLAANMPSNFKAVIGEPDPLFKIATQDVVEREEIVDGKPVVTKTTTKNAVPIAPKLQVIPEVGKFHGIHEYLTDPTVQAAFSNLQGFSKKISPDLQGTKGAKLLKLRSQIASQEQLMVDTINYLQSLRNFAEESSGTEEVNEFIEELKDTTVVLLDAFGDIKKTTTGYLKKTNETTKQEAQQYLVLVNSILAELEGIESYDIPEQKTIRDIKVQNRRVYKSESPEEISREAGELIKGYEPGIENTIDVVEKINQFTNDLEGEELVSFIDEIQETIEELIDSLDEIRATTETYLEDVGEDFKGNVEEYLSFVEDIKGTLENTLTYNPPQQDAIESIRNKQQRFYGQQEEISPPVAQSVPALSAKQRQFNEATRIFFAKQQQRIGQEVQVANPLPVQSVPPQFSFSELITKQINKIVNTLRLPNIASEIGEKIGQEVSKSRRSPVSIAKDFVSQKYQSAQNTVKDFIFPPKATPTYDEIFPSATSRLSAFLGDRAKQAYAATNAFRATLGFQSKGDLDTGVRIGRSVAGTGITNKIAQQVERVSPSLTETGVKSAAGLAALNTPIKNLINDVVTLRGNLNFSNSLDKFKKDWATSFNEVRKGIQVGKDLQKIEFPIDKIFSPKGILSVARQLTIGLPNVVADIQKKLNATTRVSQLPGIISSAVRGEGRLQTFGQSADQLSGNLKTLGFAFRTGFSGLEKGLKLVEDATNKVFPGLGDQVTKFARGFLVFETFKRFGDVIKNVGIEAIKAYAQIDRMQTALNFSAGGKQQGQAAMDFVRAQVEEKKIPMQGALEGYTQIAAAARGSTIAGAGVDELFKGTSSAATVLSLSGEQTQGAMLAFSQIISKGKASSEELRQQLGERIPGIMSIAARSMGLADAQFTKLLENGLIPASELIPKLGRQMEIEFGGSAEEASKNVLSSIYGVENSLKRLQVGIGKALAPATGVVLNTFNSALKGVSNTIEENGDVIGKFVTMGGFNLLVTGLGMITASVGSVSLLNIGLMGLSTALGFVARYALPFIARFAAIQAVIYTATTMLGAFTDKGADMAAFADQSTKRLEKFQEATKKLNKELTDLSEREYTPPPANLFDKFGRGLSDVGKGKIGGAAASGGMLAGGAGAVAGYGAFSAAGGAAAGTAAVSAAIVPALVAAIGGAVGGAIGYAVNRTVMAVRTGGKDSSYYGYAELARDKRRIAAAEGGEAIQELAIQGQQYVGLRVNPATGKRELAAKGDLAKVQEIDKQISRLTLEASIPAPSDQANSVEYKNKQEQIKQQLSVLNNQRKEAAAGVTEYQTQVSAAITDLKQRIQSEQDPQVKQTLESNLAVLEKWQAKINQVNAPNVDPLINFTNAINKLSGALEDAERKSRAFIATQSIGIKQKQLQSFGTDMFAGQKADLQQAEVETKALKTQIQEREKILEDLNAKLKTPDFGDALKLAGITEETTMGDLQTKLKDIDLAPENQRNSKLKTAIEAEIRLREERGKTRDLNLQLADSQLRVKQAIEASSIAQLDELSRSKQINNERKAEEKNIGITRLQRAGKLSEGAATNAKAQVGIDTTQQNIKDAEAELAELQRRKPDLSAREFIQREREINQRILQGRKQLEEQTYDYNKTRLQNQTEDIKNYYSDLKAITDARVAQGDLTPEQAAKANLDIIDKESKAQLAAIEKEKKLVGDNPSAQRKLKVQEAEVYKSQQEAVKNYSQERQTQINTAYDAQRAKEEEALASGSKNFEDYNQDRLEAAIQNADQIDAVLEEQRSRTPAKNKLALDQIAQQEAENHKKRIDAYRQYYDELNQLTQNKYQALLGIEENRYALGEIQANEYFQKRLDLANQSLDEQQSALDAKRASPLGQDPREAVKMDIEQNEITKKRLDNLRQFYDDRENLEKANIDTSNSQLEAGFQTGRIKEKSYYDQRYQTTLQGINRQRQLLNERRSSPLANNPEEARKIQQQEAELDQQEAKARKEHLDNLNAIAERAMNRANNRAKTLEAQRNLVSERAFAGNRTVQNQYKLEEEKLKAQKDRQDEEYKNEEAHNQRLRSIKYDNPVDEEKRIDDVETSNQKLIELNKQRLDTQIAQEDNHRERLKKSFDDALEARKLATDEAVALLNREKEAQDLVVASIDRQAKLVKSRDDLNKSQDALTEFRGQNQVDKYNKALELRRRLDDENATPQVKEAVKGQLASLGFSEGSSELDIISQRQQAEDALAMQKQAAMNRQLELQKLQNELDAKRTEQLARQAVQQAQINELTAGNNVISAQKQLNDALTAKVKDPAAIAAAEQGVRIAQMQAEMARQQVLDKKEELNVTQQILSEQRANTALQQELTKEQFAKSEADRKSQQALERAEASAKNIKNSISSTPALSVNAGTSTKGRLAFSDVQQRFRGGEVRAGQPYVVGEDPTTGAILPSSEIFVPEQAGRILSARETREILQPQMSKHQVLQISKVSVQQDEKQNGSGVITKAIKGLHDLIASRRPVSNNEFHLVQQDNATEKVLELQRRMMFAGF